MKKLTVREAVKQVFHNTISVTFIYKQIRAGKIPHCRLSTGTIILDEDELKKWWKETAESTTRLHNEKYTKLIQDGYRRFNN